MIAALKIFWSPSIWQLSALVVRAEKVDGIFKQGQHFVAALDAPGMIFYVRAAEWRLLKKYRDVTWSLELSIRQVKNQFRIDYDCSIATVQSSDNGYNIYLDLWHERQGIPCVSRACSTFRMKNSMCGFETLGNSVDC